MSENVQKRSHKNCYGLGSVPQASSFLSPLTLYNYKYDWMIEEMKPLIFILAGLVLFTHTLVAHDEPGQSKRVHLVKLPIEVSSTVGGSNIDSYVVQLTEGQKLHVQVENQTENSKVYFDTVLAGTETRFGSDSSEDSWSGVAPKTGDYEIRIIAHPAAKYRLRGY